ncbi:MAG TPA: PAC2 family protein [Acidimicrobiales bacterium]|nr:PAC2 family protein [Acidimicrobiales bacterium]
MEIVQWEARPRLRRPILVAAFEGWSDGADAASTAMSHLIDTWSARPFASIDPEDFFDFTATRPRVRLDDDLVRRIEWPENQLLAAPLPASNHDVVLLSGTEPHLRWKTFCSGLVGAIQSLGVEMVVTLGALLADVAHTQPVRVTGTAADPDLAERLNLRRSRYEGPTGILGVLSDALAKADIPTASLWAAVPHYVAQTPSPKAALALVERAASLLGVTADVVDLQLASSAYERKVTELVQNDPDVAEYVAQLERDDDTGPDADSPLEIGGVDELAAEVERFLRGHGPK